MQADETTQAENHSEYQLVVLYVFAELVVVDLNLKCQNESRIHYQITYKNNYAHYNDERLKLDECSQKLKSDCGD